MLNRQDAKKKLLEPPRRQAHQVFFYEAGWFCLFIVVLGALAVQGSWRLGGLKNNL
jgi:hypothetical protein